MKYEELIQASHKLLSQQFERWGLHLYDDTHIAPTNISIICRADWDFRERLWAILNELSKYQSHQFIYPIEDIHSTIAYFPSEYIDVDALLGVLKIESAKYDIEYFHHGFLPSPRGEGLVWIVEPKDGWRFKIASAIEQVFWVNQWRKINNPIIEVLITRYARSYLMKFKKMPSDKDIDYLKSLSGRSLWSWRPKEICVYRTNSPLLTNAELLWRIVL